MTTPMFILVELDLDQWIVAQRMDTDPPTYRKFLTAVGRPAARRVQAALMETEAAEEHPDAGIKVTKVSRVKITDPGQGTISSPRADDLLEEDTQ